MVNGVSGQPTSHSMDGETVAPEPTRGSQPQASSRGVSSRVEPELASGVGQRLTENEAYESVEQIVRTRVMVSDSQERRQGVRGRTSGFFTGMMKAVQAILTAVEGIVNGGNPAVAEASPAAHDVVEYASVRSSASLEGRRDPPPETQVPATPLFDEQVLTRLNQMSVAAQHLYPTDTGRPGHELARPSSVTSSDIQAEVRRQLSEMMAVHEDESRRLRAQVNQLVNGMCTTAWTKVQLRVLESQRHQEVQVGLMTEIASSPKQTEKPEVIKPGELWECTLKEANTWYAAYLKLVDVNPDDEKSHRSLGSLRRARRLRNQRELIALTPMTGAQSRSLTDLSGAGPVERRGAQVPTPPPVPTTNSNMSNQQIKSMLAVPVTLAGDSKDEWLRTPGGTLVVPPVSGEALAQPRAFRELTLLVQGMFLWSVASIAKGAPSRSDPTATSDLYGLDPSPPVRNELSEYEPSIPGREPHEEFPDLWDLDEDWRDNEEDLQEQLLSSSVYAVNGSEPVDLDGGPHDSNQRSDQEGVVPFLEGWDEPVPEDKVEFERLVEELSQPTEQVVLRYFGELRSKSGADVAEAIQKMVLEINKLYPVRIVHCDLGTEFLSTKLSQWLTSKVKNTDWLCGSQCSLLDVLHRLKKPRGGLNDLMFVEVSDSPVEVQAYEALRSQEFTDAMFRKLTSWFLNQYLRSALHERGTCEDLNWTSLMALGFPAQASPEVSIEVKAVSPHERDDESEHQEETSQAIGVDIMSDLQEDTAAQIVGWDPVGSNTTNAQQMNLEERDLYEFLDEREVSRATTRMLEYMGVESPADLAFLYFEDLIEFGAHQCKASVLTIRELRRDEQDNNGATEINTPVLPAESSQSQDQAEMIRLQNIWECDSEDEWNLEVQEAMMSMSSGAQGLRDVQGYQESSISVRKVDENMYTKDVEGILNSLTSQLRVVHNVSPSEVRMHLDRWCKAAQTEVTALEAMKAIRRLKGQEARDELNLPDTQVLPAKTVFTVKPGSDESWYRRKCRVVGCGNYEVKEPGLDVYAGGIPADVLRTCLIESGSKSYRAFITDVRNAFLLAPIPTHEKVRILLKPPRVLCDMGITSPDEYWAVDKAMYGLRQSPRWWGNFRDDVLRSATWNCDNEELHLEQCAVEPNLWTLVNADGSVCGYAIVYVDDILILSSKSHADALHAFITSQWECTPLQEATEDKPVTFLGVDIHLARDSAGTVGFELSQTGYIDELLRAYCLNPSKKTCPLPREWVRELPEAEQYSPEALRKAQRITGELLWITQRTRVDLAFAVSLMSSWCTRSPSMVEKIGMRLLEYIGCTKEYRLSLIPDMSWDHRVVVYTDASFAPYGGLSITGVLIMYLGKVVLWKGKRQSMITLSTAEAELHSAVEGDIQLADGLTKILPGATRSHDLETNRAAICLVMLTLMMQMGEADSVEIEDGELEPIGPELSVLAILLALSEAVRRAIEREVEDYGVRRRATGISSQGDDGSFPCVHVQVDARSGVPVQQPMNSLPESTPAGYLDFQPYQPLLFITIPLFGLLLHLQQELQSLPPVDFPIGGPRSLILRFLTMDLDLHGQEGKGWIHWEDVKSVYRPIP
ncbi:GIP [Symbiodinium sp. CCMP2592]|nr:GIP [Symbiodinium sp. CCMP2592]